MNTAALIIDIVSAVLAIVAFLVSIVTSRKQATLETKLSLYNKRDDLIHKINKDDFVDRLDIEMAFSDCTNLFNNLMSKKQAMNNAKVDISEYFSYLSESEQIPADDLKRQFQLEEISADEAADDSFIKFCKARELSYSSYPGSDLERRNYISLSAALTNAELEYGEAKKKLIEAMLSEMK